MSEFVFRATKHPDAYINKVYARLNANTNVFVGLACDFSDGSQVVWAPKGDKYFDPLMPTYQKTFMTRSLYMPEGFDGISISESDISDCGTGFLDLHFYKKGKYLGVVGNGRKPYPSNRNVYTRIIRVPEGELVKSLKVKTKCVPKHYKTYIAAYNILELHSVKEAYAYVNGDWSRWSSGVCSNKCGDGTVIKKRVCMNPHSFGTAYCDGKKEDSKKEYCKGLACAVDGGWSDWGDWGECDKPCGGGFQLKKRTCTNPAPSIGGKDCEGADGIQRPCNTQACPIDGGWSEWDDWSECSSECGGGEKKRSRRCDNPSPTNGGNECVGTAIETAPCNTQACPVDGGWSEWGAWSECMNGKSTRNRVCDNPSPAHGGKDCEGEEQQSQECGYDYSKLLFILVILVIIFRFVIYKNIKQPTIIGQGETSGGVSGFNNILI